MEMNSILDGSSLIGEIDSAEQELVGELNNAIIETGDYNKLENKPSINGKQLKGDVSLQDIGVDTYDKSYIDEQLNTIKEKLEDIEKYDYLILE